MGARGDDLSKRLKMGSKTTLFDPTTCQVHCWVTFQPIFTNRYIFRMLMSCWTQWHPQKMHIHTIWSSKRTICLEFAKTAISQNVSFSSMRRRLSPKYIRAPAFSSVNVFTMTSWSKLHLKLPNWTVPSVLFARRTFHGSESPPKSFSLQIDGIFFSSYFFNWKHIY